MTWPEFETSVVNVRTRNLTLTAHTATVSTRNTSSQVHPGKRECEPSPSQSFNSHEVLYRSKFKPSFNTYELFSKTQTNVQVLSNRSYQASTSTTFPATRSAIGRVPKDRPAKTIAEHRWKPLELSGPLRFGKRDTYSRS